MIRINRQLHQQIMAAAKDQGVTAGAYLYHVLHTYWSQNGTAPISADSTKACD